MSNFFLLDEEFLAKVNKNRNGISAIKADLMTQFRTAVNNNQVSIALEYMVYMLDLIEKKFSEEEKISAPQTSAEAPVVEKKKSQKAVSEQQEES